MGIAWIFGIIKSLGDGFNLVAPLAPVDAGFSKGPLRFARCFGGNAKNEALFYAVPDAEGHLQSSK